MTQARRRTGEIGERVACEALIAAGARIVDRNWRTRHGELDIVALEGRTLAFVEVKALRAGTRSGPERPVLAVGRRKQLQVRRLARAWLADGPAPRCSSIRFDVIGIRLDAAGRPLAVEHLRNAF